MQEKNSNHADYIRFPSGNTINFFYIWIARKTGNRELCFELRDPIEPDRWHKLVREKFSSREERDEIMKLILSHKYLDH